MANVCAFFSNFGLSTSNGVDSQNIGRKLEAQLNIYYAHQIFGPEPYRIGSFTTRGENRRVVFCVRAVTRSQDSHMWALGDSEDDLTRYSLFPSRVSDCRPDCPDRECH